MSRSFRKVVTWLTSGYQKSWQSEWKRRKLHITFGRYSTSHSTGSTTVPIFMNPGCCEAMRLTTIQRIALHQLRQHSWGLRRRQISLNKGFMSSISVILRWGDSYRLVPMHLTLILAVAGSVEQAYRNKSTGWHSTASASGWWISSLLYNDCDYVIARNDSDYFVYATVDSTQQPRSPVRLEFLISANTIKEMNLTSHSPRIAGTCQEYCRWK